MYVIKVKADALTYFYYACKKSEKTLDKSKTCGTIIYEQLFICRR